MEDVNMRLTFESHFVREVYRDVMRDFNFSSWTKHQSSRSNRPGNSLVNWAGLGWALTPNNPFNSKQNIPFVFDKEKNIPFIAVRVSSVQQGQVRTI